jgi:hypothetical protein
MMQSTLYQSLTMEVPMNASPATQPNAWLPMATSLSALAWVASDVKAASDV